MIKRLFCCFLGFVLLLSALSGCTAQETSGMADQKLELPEQVEPKTQLTVYLPFFSGGATIRGELTEVIKPFAPAVPPCSLSEWVNNP